MKFLKSACWLMALPALALFGTQAYSETSKKEVASVVVTGSRFSNETAPMGASVITATEIQNAGIDNVNEAVRKLAGVYGRRNSRGTDDFDLDLDGFGADSSNNLVILIDGVRLSESEITVALLSSIPIDSVARIEIVRGGGSVLYGDGATGGVIHIITKQLGPTPLTGSISGEVGQFHQRDGRISLARGWDNVNLSLNLNDLHSDNYRVNNTVAQRNINGALTWYGDAGRWGLRIDSSRQDFGFPGAMSLAQFEQDPRQSLTPFDHGSIALDRITAFGEKKFDAWQVAAELSTRDRTTISDFVSMKSHARYSGRQTSFTPRLRHLGNVHGMQNELVVGVDLMNWNRQTESNYSLAYAAQKSSALYFRDELSTEKVKIAFGARREVFDKSSTDPFVGSVDNYSVVQGVNAWEVQGSYAFTPEVTVFSKVGQSYRVANVDDNSFTSQPNTPLLPQLSHDMEVGTELGDLNRQLTVRFFRHNLSNEIYFDPLANHGFGANSNLDPTRRQGVSLEAKWRLSKQFRIAAQFRHVNAEFTDGANAGKELVLVPKNTAAAHINWIPGNGHKAYAGVQWVGTQRYGGDFTNACSTLIPSHVTVDARYSITVHEWELALAGSNLTNKQYFTNAFGCRTGIYPDDGRQFKLSVRYSF